MVLNCELRPFQEKHANKGSPGGEPFDSCQRRGTIDSDELGRVHQPELQRSMNGSSTKELYLLGIQFIFFDLNGILNPYNHHSSIAAMDYTCWCALGRQGALFCMQHLGPNSYTNNLLSLDHHHRLQGHCKGSNIECADKTLSGMWIHLADPTSIKKGNHSLVFTFISLKSFWIVLNWGLQTHPQQKKMTSKQIRARGLFKLNMAATKSASP